MPEAAADPTAALVALLTAAGFAAGRVFGGELPADEAPSMPRKALVVASSGGVSLTGGSFARHDAQRFDLFGYGATPTEAEQLVADAALFLRQVRRTVAANVLVHWVKPAGGSAGARDPDAAWPRAFQSFQVFHSLTEV